MEKSAEKNIIRKILSNPALIHNSWPFIVANSQWLSKMFPFLPANFFKLYTVEQVTPPLILYIQS